MRKVVEMSYMIATDLVYLFVCSDEKEGSVVFEYEGKEWAVYNYSNGGNGLYPSVTITREENDWLYFSEFSYCRHERKIVAFKKEGFKMEEV